MQLKINNTVFIIERAISNKIFVSWNEDGIRRTRWILHSGYAAMYRAEQLKRAS
jgi:hypothetical protein